VFADRKAQSIPERLSLSSLSFASCFAWLAQAALGEAAIFSTSKKPATAGFFDVDRFLETGQCGLLGLI